MVAKPKSCCWSDGGCGWIRDSLLVKDGGVGSEEVVFGDGREVEREVKEYREVEEGGVEA